MRRSLCRRTVRLSPAVLALLLLACAYAEGVEVADVRWGFDGRVVPERINLLSVLVTNERREYYDGAAVLTRVGSMGRRFGARQVQPCFVAPFTSRWVQFYPYVGGEGEEWRLTLGRKQAELPVPRPGPPAVVRLRGPDAVGLPRGPMKTFPDVLFPTSVSATDGLGAVLLDYVPRWGPPRRRALLDWIHRGGTLHLLQDADGRYPTFSAELAPLNNALPRFRVGAGLVVRHPVRRTEADADYLAARGLSSPQMLGGEPWRPRTEDTVFSALKGSARPKHSWALIYLTLLAYLVLIAPVNYLLARRTTAVGRALLFLVVAVVGATLLLSFLGRRGYGEVGGVSQLSYARWLGRDQYDVTQWVNVFVMDGDYYELSHRSRHDIYSSCQELEAVNGVVQCGPEGRFRVDIPMFSSRSFLHRAKMSGHDLGLDVVRWEEGEEGLRHLVFSTGAGFPEEVLEAWVLHEGTFYPAVVTDGHLAVSGQGGLSREMFLSRGIPEASHLGGGRYYRYSARDESRTTSELFRELAPRVIARCLGGTERSRYRFTRETGGPGSAQLFVLARSPEAFSVRCEGLGPETGCVLYHLDLFKPETADE